MACNIFKKDIKDLKRIHNNGVALRDSLMKDIKKSQPEYTQAEADAMLDLVLDELNVPPILGDNRKPHVVYKKVGNKKEEVSQDVHMIRRVPGGYEILYTTEKNQARSVRINPFGKVINQDGTVSSKSSGSTYNMENVNATYKKFDSLKTENNKQQRIKETELEQSKQKVFEFNSESNEKIEFSRENAEVIDAELINDMNKSEEVFNELLAADQTKLEPEHIAMLRETLRSMTDPISKIIPDMVQVIKKDAEKNAGRVILDGDNQGLYINLHQGAQKAGNQMSAAEMYVHELKHASLEYAQKDKKSYIANTMNDIIDIYESFLEVVTEEDFMPPLNKSIDRNAERKIAKARIEYLRQTDVGLNEFIVMSETNLVVQKVLEDRVIAGKDKKSGNTIFEKLIALITNLYNAIYTLMRGDTKNLDGASAMTKYIREISAVNNVAVEELGSKNLALKAFNDVMDFMNQNGSTLIKKGIKKIQKNIGTQEGTEFTEELSKMINNPEDFSVLQKAKFLSKMIGRWLSSSDVETVGSFETYLELFGIKPEGTIQQLIRVFRDSDEQETIAEALGLQANRVEYKVETVLSQQSELIKELFNEDLSSEDSTSLTNGVLNIDLKSMIDTRYNGSEKEQIADLISYMTDETKLDEEIDSVEQQLRIIIDSDGQSNFMINQAKALGKYMVTGEAHAGSLLNSFMIYGMANLNNSKKNIIGRNDKDENGFNKMLIDRLATLQGIKNTDKSVKTRVTKFLKTEPKAITSIMNYDKLLYQQLIENDTKDYNHEINHVKGYHEKINANWITPKVGLAINKEAMEKENYSVISDGTYSREYDLYLNMDYTEPGWAAEGVITTNDGNSINSFLNVFKEQIVPDGENIYDPEQITKTREVVRRELIRKEKEVKAAMAEMQKANPSVSQNGMRPVFTTGENGKMFVTDMDISVNKPIFENKMRTKTSVDAVLAKSYSRAVGVFEAKKNNKRILDAIQKDMDLNYEEGKAQGSKNLMSYVKIGPGEDNKLSKEIWGVLPRYMKVDIMKRHYLNSKREIAKLAEEEGIGENKDKIWSDKAVKLQEELREVTKETNPSMERLLSINKQLHNELSNNLVDLVKTNKSPREAKILKDKMDKIHKTSPYVAVRRNLVYHYFGNKETELLPFTDSKKMNMVVSFMKKIDMMWKHLVKIAKVNIVLRDLPVLTMNILSNVLLAVLQGRNPLTEISEQIRGIINLHKYREDNRMIEKLNTKIKSGNHTKADVDKLKEYTIKINKNPVKPLVDAGLYTSATEDLSNEDLHRESYLDHISNSYMKKLPQGVKDALNVAYLTKETPAFKMLLLAMQYSDFGARYSTYYRLTEQGVDKKTALKKVLDNQINYGFSHGKLLQWLNARGFVMFSKFIEGIQRVIKNTTIDKPFNVAVAAMSGGMLWDDSPLGDNVFGLNYGARLHTPYDIFETLTEAPALYQIATGNY